MFGALAGAVLPHVAGLFSGGAATQYGDGVGPASPTENAGSALERGVNAIPVDIREGISSGIGAGLGERAEAFVSGRPQPGDGKAHGKFRKDFNDAAFPGTSPWSQINSGASGGAASSAAAPQRSAERSQERIAKRNNATDIQKSRIAARATVDAASIARTGSPNAPPDAGSLNAANTGLRHFQRDEIIARIQHTTALTSVAEQDVAIKRYEQQFKEFLSERYSDGEIFTLRAEAKLTNERYGTHLGGLISATKDVLDKQGITGFSPSEVVIGALALAAGAHVAADLLRAIKSVFGTLRASGSLAPTPAKPGRGGIFWE